MQVNGPLLASLSLQSELLAICAHALPWLWHGMNWIRIWIACECGTPSSWFPSSPRTPPFPRIRLRNNWNKFAISAQSFYPNTKHWNSSRNKQTNRRTSRRDGRANWRTDGLRRTTDTAKDTKLRANCAAALAAPVDCRAAAWSGRLTVNKSRRA